MRIEPFRIEIPAICRILEVSESSCRCGSCETVHLKIIDGDEPTDSLEYNTKNEMYWTPINALEAMDNQRLLARLVFELAKMAHTNADLCA